MNEEELSQEMLLQEKTENDENDLPADPGQPASFRLKEKRTADPSNPPLIIDLAGNLSNVRDLKLSDVASEITYIRFQKPPDSTFSTKMSFLYYLTDNFIISSSLYGIIQYSYDGRYINTIVKNQYTGIGVYQSSPGSYGIVSFSDHTLTGSLYGKFRSNRDILQYSYLNNIEGQEFLMEYDCSADHLSPTGSFDPEDPSRITGLGKPVVDLNHGRIDHDDLVKSRGGMSSSSPGYIEQGYKISWIDDQAYYKKLSGNTMLGIFSKEGDTLAVFDQHDRLINYSKSIKRGTDPGHNYEFNGKIMFRDAFNDTVFQVLPPNQLLPVYVIKFGEYKTNRQQGVDPGFDLKGKIILKNFAETHTHIFLTFTLDDYDCPNNRKAKKVKIYHAIFSKGSKQLHIIKGDPYDYSNVILDNNIDGGLAVWPSPTNISKGGIIVKSFKGFQLKGRVNSESFRSSAIPEEKKSKLKQLASVLSDDEEVLMLIK